MKNINKGEYGCSIFLTHVNMCQTPKVILRRGERKRENNGGDETNQVQYMYIWKSHNETPE
jgi:hypothetical protein